MVGREMAKSRMSEKSSWKTVQGYIDGLSGRQKKIVPSLVALVREAAPEASLAIKWAQPVLEQNGPFCYVRAFKSHVNLGFWRGIDISTGRGILQSGGQKMGHIKIVTENDIQRKLLRTWVKEAVSLNQAMGDPTKGK